MLAKSKKPKKKKQASIPLLKKKLWEVTSEYIRYRATNSGGFVACVTCGVVKFWKADGMQAGHFIPAAQGNATRWELDNIHPQCSKCNVLLGSNGPEYYPYMVNRYGQERVDELRRLSNTTIKITRAEFEAMIHERSALLAAEVSRRRTDCDIPVRDMSKNHHDR